MMKYWFSFVLQLVSLCVFSQAQKHFFVSGRVSDENGNAIELVNINQLGTSHVTQTSANGSYTLMVEERDSIIIRYAYMGETATRIITNRHSDTVVNVQLILQAIELDGSTVYGNEKTSTMESLSPEDFRLMPGTEGIEGFLSTQLVRTTELSSQYSVRGGSYDENIVYVNDIEIYRPLLVRSGQQEGLSFINPDMVESVSFSAGGFEAKYGDKMSSVLDISYKKPTGFEASASVSLLGASAYLGTSSNKFTQIHGIRYKTSRYLLGSLDEKGEYSPNFVDYQTYLTYNFSPHWEMTFLGNFSRNSYEFIPETRNTSFGPMGESKSFTVYFDGHEQDLFQTFFGALTLYYKPTKNVSLGIMASAFQTDEEETYDIGGEYWLSELNADGSSGTTLGIGTYHEHARNRLKANVVNISHIGDLKVKKHSVKWGIGMQEENISDRIKEWEMRDSAGYSIPPPYHTNQTDQILLYRNLSGNNDLNSYRFQAFFQDSYKHSWDKGSFTATAGIRSNYWTFNDELLISPRVSFGLIPKWKRNYVFRFAGGLYYQAPFYKELRYTGKDDNGNNIIKLNKDINAQQTLHFVLGSDYYFNMWDRPFKLTAEAYYKPAQRLIPYVVDNLQIVYLSKETAKGYTAGLDVKLFGELVPGTDSWVGFSLMQSKEDIKGNKYGYISRPNEQRYGFTLFFQDYFPNNPNYKVHLKIIWEDGLPFGPPDSPEHIASLRMPSYRRVDIGASRILVNGEGNFMSKSFFKHVKNIWLTLEVFNLLNISNVNSYYWVSDASNMQYGVPNFLTSRQLNIKLAVDFK